MSTDRIVPRPMLTPYYCVVWGRTRVLEWGLFATRAEAQSRIDEHCQMAPKLRPDLKVEPIWVSRRRPEPT